MMKRAIDFQRVGVEQQLRYIEAVTGLGLPGPLRAEAVARAFMDAVNDTVVHIAQPLGQRQARHFHIVLEHAEEHPRGMPRHDGNVHALRREGDAERQWRCAGR